MSDVLQSSISVQVQKLHPEARLPRYSHSGAWGDLAADLYSVSACTLHPGETVAVPTGIALGLPAEYGALVEDRSGMALRGLTTLAGVIDPGYRGEVKVVLTNLSPSPHSISPGDRVAQLRLVRRIEATFAEVTSLDATIRAAGGFGSTGV
jgi:dUTP pyrophosphatase